MNEKINTEEDKMKIKLFSASRKIQEMIKQSDRAINELRPIAKAMGYSINPNTGELIK